MINREPSTDLTRRAFLALSASPPLFFLLDSLDFLRLAVQTSDSSFLTPLILATRASNSLILKEVDASTLARFTASAALIGLTHQNPSDRITALQDSMKAGLTLDSWKSISSRFSSLPPEMNALIGGGLNQLVGLQSVPFGRITPYAPLYALSIGHLNLGEHQVLQQVSKQWDVNLKALMLLPFSTVASANAGLRELLEDARLPADFAALAGSQFQDSIQSLPEGLKQFFSTLAGRTIQEIQNSPDIADEAWKTVTSLLKDQTAALQSSAQTELAKLNQLSRDAMAVATLGSAILNLVTGDEGAGSAFLEVAATAVSTYQTAAMIAASPLGFYGAAAYVVVTAVTSLLSSRSRRREASFQELVANALQNIQVQNQRILDELRQGFSEIKAGQYEILRRLQELLIMYNRGQHEVVSKLHELKAEVDDHIKLTRVLDRESYMTAFHGTITNARSLVSELPGNVEASEVRRLYDSFHTHATVIASNTSVAGNRFFELREQTDYKSLNDEISKTAYIEYLVNLLPSISMLLGRAAPPANGLVNPIEFTNGLFALLELHSVTTDMSRRTATAHLRDLFSRGQELKRALMYCASPSALLSVKRTMAEANNECLGVFHSYVSRSVTNAALDDFGHRVIGPAVRVAGKAIYLMHTDELAWVYFERDPLEEALAKEVVKHELISEDSYFSSKTYRLRVGATNEEIGLYEVNTKPEGRAVTAASPGFDGFNDLNQLLGRVIDLLLEHNFVVTVKDHVLPALKQDVSSFGQLDRYFALSSSCAAIVALSDWMGEKRENLHTRDVRNKGFLRERVELVQLIENACKKLKPDTSLNESRDFPVWTTLFMTGRVLDDMREHMRLVEQTVSERLYERLEWCPDTSGPLVLDVALAATAGYLSIVGEQPRLAQLPAGFFTEEDIEKMLLAILDSGTRGFVDYRGEQVSGELKWKFKSDHPAFADTYVLSTGAQTRVEFRPGKDSLKRGLLAFAERRLKFNEEESKTSTLFGSVQVYMGENGVGISFYEDPTSTSYVRFGPLEAHKQDFPSNIELVDTIYKLLESAKEDFRSIATQGSSVPKIMLARAVDIRFRPQRNQFSKPRYEADYAFAFPERDLAELSAGLMAKLDRSYKLRTTKLGFQCTSDETRPVVTVRIWQEKTTTVIVRAPEKR